jgi:hypothetical protein
MSITMNKSVMCHGSVRSVVSGEVDKLIHENVVWMLRFKMTSGQTDKGGTECSTILGLSPKAQIDICHD